MKNKVRNLTLFGLVVVLLVVCSCLNTSPSKRQPAAPSVDRNLAYTRGAQAVLSTCGSLFTSAGSDPTILQSASRTHACRQRITDLDAIYPTSRLTALDSAMSCYTKSVTAIIDAAERDDWSSVNRNIDAGMLCIERVNTALNDLQ